MSLRAWGAIEADMLGPKSWYAIHMAGAKRESIANNLLDYLGTLVAGSAWGEGNWRRVVEYAAQTQVFVEF